MSMLERLRYWIAKPYLHTVSIYWYEVGKIEGMKEMEERYRHIRDNWQPVKFKPISIGARERANLAAFRRANLKRLT